MAGELIRLGKSTIRAWRRKDAAALVRAADDREVWRNLLDAFPNPYTSRDARDWIAFAGSADPLTHFAVEADGAVAGGIGLTFGEGNFRRTASVGYWLGRAWWRKGIMGEVLPAFTAWGFEEFSLTRVEAAVFEGNDASAGLLAKSGYTCEGWRRRSVLKDGRVLDQSVWAMVR